MNQNLDLPSRQLLAEAKTVVVKVGSSLLASVGGGVKQEFIGRLCAQLAELRRQGREVVLVSSGAVAAGMVRLGLKQRPADLRDVQAAAAVGQPCLMWHYREAFEPLGLKAGQVLLTRDGLHDRRRYLYARNTLRALLDFGVIPIINENDAIAIEELKLKLGDNDALAVSVAQLVDADCLLILSDVPGFYDRPPQDKEAALIAQVMAKEFTPELFEKAGGSVSGVGSGGMASKLSAALAAVMAAVPLVIADGKRDNVILDVLAGQEVGTFFAPSRKRIDARRRWLAFGRSPAGRLTVDAGAVRALVERKKSLLPIGIKDIEGEFNEADSVSIVDLQGAEVARGISNYSSADLRRIAGKRTPELAEILGGEPDETAVHRDNLVVLRETD